MEKKYINLIKEAEALFDEIIKDSSFTKEMPNDTSIPFLREDRELLKVCLTNKT